MSDGGPADPGPAEVSRGAAERLTFFSDAVVAIAITLLALDLPVPAGADGAAVLRSLADHRFEYLTFLVGFLVIGAHWAAHHRVFRWLVAVGRGLVPLSLAWLLLVVVTPFLIRVLREGEPDVVRVGVFAVAQALLLVVFAAMVTAAARRGSFAPAVPASVVRQPWVHAGIGVLAFLVSVPLFPLLGRWAFLLWAAAPVLTPRLLRRS